MIGWMLVALVFILGPLMFLHELGHFWAAKKNGIPVEEFGFGLGPKLLTLFVRNGTQYTIRAIPFAAFVSIRGEEDSSREDGLMNAPRMARLIISAGGPTMNIIAAVVLLWVAYLFGPPAYTRVLITRIDPGSPAESAGLQVDDLVLQADDTLIEDQDALADYTNAHLGQPINLLVERDGEEINLGLTPRQVGQYNPDVEGPMGIAMATIEAGPAAPQGIFQAIESAFGDIRQVIKGYIDFPKMLARAFQARADSLETGAPLAPQDDPRNFRPVGIVGILQLIAYTLQSGLAGGYWIYIFRMAGYFSLVLGLTNLLPLPALDGGRILFVALDWLSETFFHHRINPEREVIVHAIGMAALLLLMFFITWQDIFNPIPLLQSATPTPMP